MNKNSAASLFQCLLLINPLPPSVPRTHGRFRQNINFNLRRDHKKIPISDYELVDAKF